jgi:hypothetical protein
MKKGSAAGRAAAAAVVALAMAGCGSTVQLSPTAAAGQNSLGGPGLSAGVSSGTAGNPLVKGQPGSSTVVSGTTTFGTVGSRATSSQAGGAAVTGSAAARPTLGSREPVRVGVIYASGVDSVAAAMGIKGLTTGDTKAQAAAMFAWINAHGGLGGHQIQAYYYDLAQNSGSSPEAAAEAACAALTQDDHVRFVQTIAVLTTSEMPCFANAGVGVLNDETGLADAAMAKYAGFLGNPGEFAPGRYESVMVDDLWRRGWLTSHSKVGILATDSADGHAVVDGALSAALHRHGLSATTQYVNPDGGDGGSAQSSSAALKFRSAGVDRVIPVLYNPLFMMEAASSQNYHPAYAMYSTNGPGALLETAAPKDQLANAAGIGWLPYYDIGSGTHPGPVSSRETLCFAIMNNAGQASTSATTKGIQVQVCNVLFYLKDLADLEPTMPADLLTSARQLLGKKFLSADTFRTDVTHRTDGVAGYRSVAYEQSCSCFQYVSGVQATS